MFGLTFLSNEKQKILQKLEDRLSKATTPQARNETLLAIQEIRAQAKPYMQCDLLEADELKSQLLQKINTLVGLGKSASAEVFQLHLKDVDFHMQTMQMSEIMREKDKTLDAAGEGPNLADRAASLSSIERDKKRKEAFSHRWVVGFEDEPDIENK